MPATTAVFFDVGGILLTNGWDRPARRRAAEQFHLNWDEFEERHESVVADFETGRIGIEGYLDCAVFHEPKTFKREEFRDFMFAQSQPHPRALAVARALARARRCLLATLNNESLDLNRHRIERFRLRDCFDVFLSSCYLGVRKPDERIYRLALQLTQRRNEECLYIDDRPLNIECARRIGMRAFRYSDAAQLEELLRSEELL